MWLSNVHTWLNPYVSALVPRSTARALGGVVCSTTPRSIGPSPRGRRSASDDRLVRVRPAVAVERPPVADLADLAQVELADDQLRLVRVAHVADELALRVDEVALPVEVVVVEGLDPHAVDRPHVVHVRDRGGGLLEPPDVLAQAAVRGRGVEHDLSAVQAEDPPALREVTVVADVHADLADRGLEHRVPLGARREVELLPEAL